MTQLTLPGLQPEPFAPALVPAQQARRTSLDRIVDNLLLEMRPGDIVSQLIALRPHAAFNALLAIAQLPYAAMLRTQSRWESEWGRRIRPGQHPIVLLAPFGPVELYFDVSQTEPGEHSRSLPLEHQSLFTMTDAPGAERLRVRIIEDVKQYGVRVVSSEVGTPLAGKIQQVSVHGSQTSKGRDVPVRWIITLAASHSSTEQLSTLVHELGHLFCGHVGSDDKDKWAQRSDIDPATMEFEAETVTQIVFGRLVPDTELPAYSERVLADASAASRADWVHVVQAADRVMKPFSKN
ncbi:MAG: ImmA/IrrE family metallo-endopeptidase [Propionibacteriales bacterium]|nr:ImmA/IrrE family metallo-endopeptidase [Propionibacteriales bacterium]